MLPLPPGPPTKSPVILIVPVDDLLIHKAFDIVPALNLIPDKLKLQAPVWFIIWEAIPNPVTALPKLSVTVPVVAVTVIRLVAPADRDADVLVALTVTPAVLKLKEPPAVVVIPASLNASSGIRTLPEFTAVILSL